MRRLVINLNDARPIWAIPDWAVERIRRAARGVFDVVVVSEAADGRGDGGTPSAEAIEAVRDAEVHLGFGFRPPLFESAAQGGKLRWVHTATAGVGGSLYPAMCDSDVLFTNSAGIQSEPMAENVIGAILYFARGFDIAVRARSERRWSNAEFSAPDSPIREVADATLGIVGYGGTGREVAQRARAMGMDVLGFRRHAAEPRESGVEILTGSYGFDRILAESDYLAITLPHTPDTDGIIDRSAIDRLQPNAVVINVGRGQLIDEAYLAEALRERRIRGAALDVFVEEPLPEDSPLWDLDNLLITPHVAATSRRFWERQTELIEENLSRYIRGTELINVVDKEAGY